MVSLFATVPLCVSGWTVASRTPGYTPPSDTSPACARNPSLPADAASTGGTLSASVWYQPRNYITSVISHQSGYDLLLLLHQLHSGLMKSNSYSTAWYVPPGRLRNKSNSSGAGCELIVNVCVCMRVVLKQREKRDTWWISGKWSINESIWLPSNRQAETETSFN